MSKSISISQDSYSIVRKVATERGITTEEAADKVLAVGMTRLRAVANHYKKAKAAKAKPKRKAAAKAAPKKAKPAKKRKPSRKEIMMTPTPPTPAEVAAPEVT